MLRHPPYFFAFRLEDVAVKQGVLGAASVVVLAVGLASALAIGGGAAEFALADPGEIVRYGLPVAKAFVSAGAALAIGGLLFRLWAVPTGPAANRVMGQVQIASLIWTLAMIAYSLFAFMSVYGLPFGADAEFGTNLQYFFADTELGQLLATTTGLAVVVSILSALTRSFLGNAAAFLAAVAAMWPFAEMAHSGGTANHAVAVSALILHIVFISVWVGGLVALVVAVRSGSDFRTLVERYSTLALLSFCIVTVSGAVSAGVRVGSFDNLVASPYGQLVIAKIAFSVALGVLGAVYRTRLIPRIKGANRGLVRLFGVEVLIMAATMGIATGLGRTATPVEDSLGGELSASEILTGRSVPEPWTFTQAITEWRLDLIWVLFAVITTFWYFAGVRRLVRRGDSWPVSRTINWVFAMIVLVYATGGGVAVYGEYLFSVHMIGHMLLTMMVPISIVLAAPVTLVMRAVHPRHDGSRGAREWVHAIVHSRWVSIVGHPLVATVIFALSLIVFYYSGLLKWSMTTHLGHEWMVVHFLVGGYLFIQALIGIDPTPHRTAYPVRFILLMGTMVFHAFFGLSLMMGESLLLPEWFGAMGRTWGDDPLKDQQVGGGIAWGVGEVPTLVLSAMVALSWVRSDGREQKRLDRKATLNHDQDLNDYNAMLEKLAARTDRSPRDGSSADS